MLAKQRVHASTVRLCLLIALLCGVLLTGSQTTAEVSAAGLSAEVGSPVESDVMVMPASIVNAPTDIVRIVCPVSFVGMNVVDTGNGDVSIFSPGCSGAGDIQYWQISGDMKKSNQVLAIALSAKSTDRNVVIFYDPNDTSGLAEPSIRRKIVALGIE